MLRLIRSARPRAVPAAALSLSPILHRSLFGFPSSSSSSSSSSLSSLPDLSSSSIPSVDPSLLPLLFGVVLANAVTSDDDNAEQALHSPPWVVRSSSPGAGLGAFATEDIDLGRLLIAERPLCAWPNGIGQAEARELFDRMSDRQKEVFMSLTDGGEATQGRLDEIRVRRACNGFSLPVPGVDGSEGKNVGFVFPKIASTPNATQVMNWTTLRLELYAITPIPLNTEITIEYLPSLITLTHSERRSALRTSFGFTSCLCPTCTASPAQIAASDARRMEIKRLVGTLRGGVKDRKRTLEGMERIRVLCEEEGVRGLPDFGDENVNHSFAVYKTLHARQQRAAEGN
ncbi:hypothetical protein JCM10207_002163 [Rhodosporidiobolus poonsookiae]